MITKVLESIFGHKRLLLLPPALVLGIVLLVVWLAIPPRYEATAAIWADRASYLKVDDDATRFSTPAQMQVSRLTQMLESRTFLADVAKRTPLASLSASTDGQQQIRSLITKDFVVVTRGNNLVMVRFRAASAELSVSVLSALLDAFKEREAKDQANQAQTAIGFFSGRVQEAEAELTKSNDTMRRYVAANPRLLDSTRSNVASGTLMATVDPQFAELRNQVELDQAYVERARQSLDQAKLQANAAIEGQGLGFQVIDPPQPPIRATWELRKVLTFPVAALLVGIGLSAALLVVLIASDRSARSPTDLPSAIRLVGTVHRFQVEGVPLRLDQDAVRHAIEYPAGAVLLRPNGAN